MHGINMYSSECISVMVECLFSSLFPFTASVTTPLVMKELWLSQRV